MSLKYRKERINKIKDAWGLTSVNDLFVEWKIPESLSGQLKIALSLYIAKAMDFEFTVNETEFIRRVDENRLNRKNITPNGGVVPKSEYQFEYNFFLKVWCDIVRQMVSGDPGLIAKFRLTPNVRIKFGLELEENIGRPLDTALPHSDGWVEGPWGMNCHVPIFGDWKNNYLNYYKMKDEAQFSESYLEISDTYKDMQWVLSNYEDDTNVLAKPGFINISDYALIHKTMRKPNCGTRISIDTTMFIGNHEAHVDRNSEYLDTIPFIGDDFYVTCKLNSGEVTNKSSTFSHYTSGNLTRVKLSS